MSTFSTRPDKGNGPWGDSDQIAQFEIVSDGDSASQGVDSDGHRSGHDTNLREVLDAVERVEEALTAESKTSDTHVSSRRAALAYLRLAQRSIVANLYEAERDIEFAKRRQKHDDRRLELLEDELEAERERRQKLETRLEAIEGLFSSRTIDKKVAHVEAQKRESTEVVERGEVYELHVEEKHIEGRDPTAVGRISGLVTFVHFDSDSDALEDLERGSFVEVQITDVQDTCAHAVPTEGGSA